jgi:hypothetical protein
MQNGNVGMRGFKVLILYQKTRKTSDLGSHTPVRALKSRKKASQDLEISSTKRWQR